MATVKSFYKVDNKNRVIVIDRSVKSSDDDWNKNDNANGRATITGYDKDENWDDGNNNSGNISGDDYPNDTNWNE